MPSSRPRPAVPPVATHPKKRLEIVVEKLRAPRVVELAQEFGISGWTVLPCLGGFGHQGMRGASEVVGVFDNVVIVIIAAEDKARPLMAAVLEALEDYAGICVISDCEVVRADHF